MTSRPSSKILAGALAGALVATGWVLVDLVVFATTGRPRNALDLVPASLVAIAIAGLAGGLLAPGIRAWAFVTLGALGASLAPLLIEQRFARHTIWLPRYVLLLLVAYALARLARRARRGTLPYMALALGAAACLAVSAYRSGWFAASIATAWAVLALACSAWLPARVRGLAAVACAVGFSFWVVPRVRHDLRPTRADLAPQTTRASGPSLVFLVLDTVRADHLAPYGYERATTPGLDAFVREHATLYTRCRSTAPFTLPAHGSMFTGLFPSEHHAARPGRSAHPLSAEARTLAERLRESGWQTAAVVANDTYLSPRFDMDRGFEHFDDRGGGTAFDYLALGQIGGGDVLRVGHLSHREAAEITDTALAWLDDDRRDGPFFLFLNYLDAHSPYFPSAAWSGAWEEARQPTDPLKPESDMRSLLYDRELAYLDHEVTRFLAGLEARGLLDQTCIVVTSDHGDDFLEHDIIEHCWGLYDSLIHVPLYVKPASGRRAPRIDEPISVADLYHLALRELGLDTEDVPRDVVAEWYPTLEFLEAYTLWVQRTGFDAEANRVAWCEGTTKWIVSSNGEVLAFDLVADPGERSPLPVDEARAEAARERARRWWAAHPLPKGEGLELDQRTLDQLEALGYG